MILTPTGNTRWRPGDPARLRPRTGMNGRPDPRNAVPAPRPGRPAGSAAGPAQPGPAVAWADATAVRDLLAGKWVLPVLEALDDMEPRRHNQLRRAISANASSISAKSLDDTLRHMVATGLVRRSVHPGNPPTVSYRLTPLAGSLLGPLASLGRWGTAHLRSPQPAGRRTRRGTAA